MTMRRILRLLPVLALGACVAPHAGNEVQRDLAGALNSRPDGYHGVMPQTGERFRILSTAASDTRLCRVVSFEQPDEFLVESFCKTKGGPWR